MVSTTEKPVTAASVRHEFLTEAVPTTNRRHPITMGLLWITMVTGFPCVLMGFQFHKEGFTLLQVLQCSLLSCVLLLMYAVPAGHIGAVSGHTYSILSRSVFGRWGARLVSLNMIGIFIVFYAVIALLMMDAFKGFFHPNIPDAPLLIGLAVVMSLNNFFGFTGVANFARFVAAPLLIAWIGYSFYLAATHCSPAVLTAVPHKSFAMAFAAISSFVLGFAVWGNEADYWRHSRPVVSFSLIPMAIALVLGEVIFPLAGWMISQVTGINEFERATAFMKDYSFGGMTMAAAIVVAAAYFAGNDSNLYGMVNSVGGICKIPHKLAVGTVTTIAAVLSLFFLTLGAASSLEIAFMLNCFIVPVPTVIMLTEWYLQKHVFKQLPFFHTIPDFQHLPAVRWPALIALLSGMAVGLFTSNLIPGTSKLNVGFPILQCWITAIVIYAVLRMAEHKQLEVLD
jgi:purine-cytosine permease-like protein